MASILLPLGWSAYRINIALSCCSYRSNAGKMALDSLPFYTPAMAGGLFSIDKENFFRLGAYDEDMEFYGAENVEMSLRVTVLHSSSLCYSFFMTPTNLILDLALRREHHHRPMLKGRPCVPLQHPLPLGRRKCGRAGDRQELCPHSPGLGRRVEGILLSGQLRCDRI